VEDEIGGRPIAFPGSPLTKRKIQLEGGRERRERKQTTQISPGAETEKNKKPVGTKIGGGGDRRRRKRREGLRSGQRSPSSREGTSHALKNPKRFQRRGREGARGKGRQGKDLNGRGGTLTVIIKRTKSGTRLPKQNKRSEWEEEECRGEGCPGKKGGDFWKLLRGQKKKPVRGLEGCETNSLREEKRNKGRRVAGGGAVKKVLAFVH